MRLMMNEEQQLHPNQVYLNEILEKYKSNPKDESLSQSEKVLVHQAYSKETRINQLFEQTKTIQDEIESKQKQLQLLDQQVVFERGQLSGIIDSLIALKPNVE